MKEGWTYKKLGEVCDIYQPKTLSSNMLLPDGKYAVYGANGIIGRYDKYNHESSEVLMTCRGATCGTINVSEPFSWINGNAMVIHPQSDELNKAYLVYVLKGIDLSNVITGAAQPQITRQSLSPTKIPIPPIGEQERIVAELDLLSGIIEKKKEQLKAYDQLAQSIFYTMFGDIFTNNKSWDIEPLGNFCEIKGRIGFRGYTKNDFVSSPDEGAISLSPTNIVNGSMDYSKCSYVTWEKYFESPEIMIQNGDILLVKTGSSYGKCSLVRHLPHKATINPQFVVIKDIQLNNVYLTFVLSTDYAKYQYDRFVLGTAIPTFSQKSLAGLGIPIPPLSLQEEFAEKVEAIERQKALVQQSIEETQTMFDYTMDKYFG